MNKTFSYPTYEFAISMRIVKFIKKLRPVVVHYPELMPLWNKVRVLSDDFQKGRENEKSAEVILDAFDKDLENFLRNL